MKAKTVDKSSGAFSSSQIAFLGVFSGGILIYKLFVFEVAEPDLPRYLVADLGIVFGLWILFVLFFASRVTAKVLLTALLMLGLSSIPVTTAKYYADDEFVQSIVQGLVSLFSGEQAPAAGEGGPSGPNASEGTGQRHTDEKQEKKARFSQQDIQALAQYLDSVMRQMTALGDRYHQRLKQVGFDAVLDPNRLEQPGARRQYESLFARAEAIRSHINEEQLLLLQSIPGGIESIALSDQAKTVFMERLAAAAPDSKKALDLMWESERELLTELSLFTRLLYENPGEWERRYGQFVSNSQLFQQQIDARLQTIRDVSQRAIGLLDGKKSRMSEAIQRLQSIYSLATLTS